MKLHYYKPAKTNWGEQNVRQHYATVGTRIVNEHSDRTFNETGIRVTDYSRGKRRMKKEEVNNFQNDISIDHDRKY